MTTRILWVQVTRSCTGILKSTKLVRFSRFSTKPVRFGFENYWFLIETEPGYCSKNVFDWFLQFIDRFLPVLKTGTVPVFESLVMYSALVHMKSPELK
jgi:hypothetical protein